MTFRSRFRAVLVDTRQKIGKHAHMDEWLESHGILAIRCKLPYGDYALAPDVSVDSKQSIYELAMDIDQEHERFHNELVLAKEAGGALYVVVENDDGVEDLSDLAEWEESARHFMMRKRKSKNPHTRKISGERLAKACITMQNRYGVVFLFCKPGERPRITYELLTGGEPIEDAEREGGEP